MSRFTATHQVPETGMDAWATPDPYQSPVSRIGAGVPVQVIGQTTGWAHIRCDNGWEAWVDDAQLVALAAPRFVPTHRVPAAGLDARDQPDARYPVASRLGGGLPVALTQSWGDWARVRCENGWEAWVDPRWLVADASPYAATSSLGSLASPVETSPLATWLPIGGAVAVILGSFLDWIGPSSAWDIPFIGLIDHQTTSTAPDAGVFLLVVLVAGLPLVTRQPLPRWAGIALGAVATNIALAAIVLYMDIPSEFRTGVDLGLGLFLTLFGGVAMAAGALMAPRSAPASAYV